MVKESLLLLEHEFYPLEMPQSLSEFSLEHNEAIPESNDTLGNLCPTLNSIWRPWVGLICK